MTASSEALNQTARALPVVQGLICLMVIGFIGETWPDLPREKQDITVRLAYGVGAHFALSYLVAFFGMLISRLSRQFLASLSIMLGLLCYVIFSLHFVHVYMFAGLRGSWTIPLPWSDLVGNIYRYDDASTFGLQLLAPAVASLGTMMTLYIVTLPFGIVFRKTSK